MLKMGPNFEVTEAFLALEHVSFFLPKAENGMQDHSCFSEKQRITAVKSINDSCYKRVTAENNIACHKRVTAEENLQIP